MVDNTFAGPLICAPVSLGADVVIESLSKAFAGHSDVHAGAILGAAAEMEACWQAMLHFGACLDPHAAWLVLRGSRTLKLRTDAACANAGRVAQWLSRQAEVEAVWYPGLAVGTEADVVAATLQQPGFMVSFAVRGGDDRALRLLEALQTVVPATSLGGVESLVSLPFNTSHRTPEARAMIGLRPGTVRLSVGIEDADDLIADLAAALQASAPGP